VCGDDQYKLYVNPVKRRFCCFKCSFTSGKNDTFDFVSKAEGISVGQAVTRLIREYAATTPDYLDIIQDDEDAITPRAAIKVLNGLPEGATLLSSRTGATAPFWDYLVNRGLTPDEILAVRFHCMLETRAPLMDSKNKYRGDIGRRLLVPVYGGNHRLVSWQARTIDPSFMGHDKYLNAPESELAKTLWPYVPPYGKKAIIVEGVLDALSVRRVPETSSYATFSKKISNEQIQILKDWGVEEVTVFWDKKDAVKEIKKAVPELQMCFKKVNVLWLNDWPKNTDAGNLLAESDGADKIKHALDDLVDTYDSLEFGKWEITWLAA